MCVLSFITFQICGHNESFLAGEACGSGFNEEKNSCSRDRNVYVSGPDMLPEGSYCFDCYATEIKSIRTRYTQQYLTVIEDARTRDLPGVAVKRSMENIEEKMQEAIDMWKATCFRKDVLNRSEAKDYLRSKVDWLRFVSVKTNEEASLEMKMADRKLCRAQAREKRLYQDWKFALKADHKTVALSH